MNANEPLTGLSAKRVQAKPVCDIGHATETSIRNVIYEIYCKQHITRYSILQLLKERDIFNGSTTSLGLILKSIGFRWKKDDLRRGLMELPRIAMVQVDFLQKYVANVNSNYFWQFVYVDETWIFEDGTVNWSWQDYNLETVRKLKSGGKKYIVIHAGNVNGFIEGASLVFSSQKHE